MPYRPIGYWVKLLDELIEARFEEALAREDLTRRHWQCMNVVSNAPGAEGTDRAALESALAPFVSPAAPADGPPAGTSAPPAGTSGDQGRDVGRSAGHISDVLRTLVDRGWLVEEGTVLRLTPEGERAHQRLHQAVGQLRRQVAAGVTEEQYGITVQTLSRMCENLRPSG